jgi:hypothetical protein
MKYYLHPISKECNTGLQVPSTVKESHSTHLVLNPIINKSKFKFPMKSIYLVLSFVLVTSANSVFANNGEDVNSSVRKTFQNEFANAENTNWSVAGRFAKATFTLHGQEWYAFYSVTGERVALARNVQVSSLPIKLIDEVRGSYNAFWITSAFEVSSENESSYFVTVENADQKITLKSLGTSGWLVYKSTSKE